MKLALCLEYHLQQAGGTEVLVQELVRGFRDRFELVLVSAEGPEQWRASPWHHQVKTHLSWNPESPDPEAGHRLARQLQDLGVQLAHFHLGGSYGWRNRRPRSCPLHTLSRMGIPCITTNHGVSGWLDGFCGEQRPAWFKLALWPWAWQAKLRQLARVRCEVAVSRADLRTLQGRYWPFRNRFRQIYHSRVRSVPRPTSEPRQRRIATLGTLAPRKGQTYLVDAFLAVAGRYPDWTLELAGRAADPALLPALKRRVAEAGLSQRVRFIGALEPADAEVFIRESEIFAMPSLVEGLGLALQEALFLGCACVASRTGGMTDLVSDGDNGLLVAPGDVAAWTAALDQLLGNPSLREAFRQRGPASLVSRGMLASDMLSAYEDLYRECLGQAAGERVQHHG